MLEPQRRELERLGFNIVAADAREVIGIRQRWHLDCLFTKLTYVVAVRRVERLSAAQIEEDRLGLSERARRLDPSRLPRGFQKGVAVLTAYVADVVEPDARELCARKPKVRFAFFYLPGVLEPATGIATFLRQTPAWGGIYFAKFRHLLGRLLEPARTAAAAPISVFGIVLSVIILGSLALMVAGMALR